MGHVEISADPLENPNLSGEIFSKSVPEGMAYTIKAKSATFD